MFEFAYPWLLLVATAPLILRWILPVHQESRYAVNVPFLDRLASITGMKPEEGAVVPRGTHWQKLGLWCCWLLLATALARPQWVEDPIVKVIPTRDLLLAVDLSGSMEAKDFSDQQGERLDRLTAVKQVLDEFLSRREGDRVGLMFFGTAPFMQVPFTEDLEVCRTLLEEAAVGMAGPQTMLGDAIGLSINVFEQSETKEKTLILLTDGNDTESQVPPARAAAIARDKGITIHTVAVGDPRTVGENEMDEQSLREIAEATGGSFFRALDRAELEGVYSELNEIETHEVDTFSYSPKHDLFQWPLAGVFLITLFFHLAKISLALKRKGLKGGCRWGSLGLVPLLAALLALVDFNAIQASFTFHFLRPFWLYALVPVLLVMVIIRCLQSVEQQPLSDVIAPHLLPHLLVGSERHRRLRPRHLLAVVFVLSCLALAGPSWTREPSPLTEDQAALFVVMEAAPSMQTRDLQPTRMERAAQKVRDLMQLREGTLNGLIAYSGSAHLVMPLTRDGSLISQFAAELSPEIMPTAGDAAYDAVALAIERLQANKVKGSILLITDGMTPGEYGRFEELRQQTPYPVHVLGMVRDSVSQAPAGFNRSQLEALAGTFSGELVMASPDSSDVERLAGQAERAMAGIIDPAAGDRWQDAGYWLVYLLSVTVLFWFRPGWVVIYG